MLPTMFGQIVIVGAGQAADQAVHTLRRKGFAGKLAVVGDEPWLPYQRPPLSKKYLAGALDRDRLLLRPSHFYTEHSVETHLGHRVQEISRATRRLRLDDGSVLPYDALLLATGSRPRPLTVPGAELVGVHTLRTIGDVERIRAQVISGLRRDTSNPSALASRKFLEVAFGNHPYSRQASGTLDSVPKIDVADMKDYVGRVIAKDTLRIAVVGDVDADTLGKLLDKTFGGLPAKANLTAISDVQAARPPQRAFIPLDVPQTVVTFGGPGIGRHDPNFMAAYVVNHILGGGGLSSRLYKEVREKRGLAYSVYESLLWMDHSAVFIGNTGTRADRAGETVDAVEKEIRRIAEDGPTQKELDEAKSYLKGSQMLALDTSSKLAQGLLQYQLDQLPIDYIEKRNAIVDAVTLDDARKAAKFLWGQGLLTVIVGRAPQAAAQPAAAIPRAAN